MENQLGIVITLIGMIITVGFFAFAITRKSK